MINILKISAGEELPPTRQDFEKFLRDMLHDYQEFIPRSELAKILKLLAHEIVP